MTRTPSRPADPAVGSEQLAALSHEFRTPLNGVLGMARLLEGTHLTEEQKSYVAAVRQSGEHLLGLVNDLLDFAKLGASKLELRPGWTEVENLLRGVCELLSPRAQEKGIEIAWSAPAGIGSILADEGRVRQILLNFAGNAIKFTSRGGVRLTAAPVGDSRIRFVVADTGPGVPQADRARIFEAFAQSDPAHDGAKLGGAGLGLAIARTLAEAMDGAVGVDEAPGGGALFWFEAELPRRAEAGEPLLAGRRVALGSGNPVVAEAARGQIEASGGQVVPSADQADILLLDEDLAGDRPPAGPPVLVLLTPESRGRIEALRAGGYAGYLIKPLRRVSLAERIGAALGQETRRTPEDERAAAAAAPGARVLLVEDNAINALLARTLLTREGCAVDHATGGQEALAALSVGDYDLILMDMRMPGLSGLETTVRLREMGIITPVVALTANAFEDDRHACLAAGMDDFLVKPLAADTLRAVLARLGGAGWTRSPAQAKVG